MARTCGTCYPPPEDSEDRETIDRFADFLRLHADGGAAAIRERVHVDPDFRALVFGSRDIHGPAF